ncbi:MAG: sugar transferase [Gammaproteobacteria bacterium]|nr:sugar transferase [Gammaproteobacteria bacterium]
MSNKHTRPYALTALKRYYWRFNPILGSLIKRSFDATAASGLLLVLSPLLLLVMVCIRLESPGPVFFRQRRIGQGGQQFNFWKFRSMYIDAEQRKSGLMQENEMRGGVIFKMRNDPRVTFVGRIIRRTSIDELPQLWNVVRGDMSLVGPRPCLPDEIENYSVHDRNRLDVAQGLTCIWQVSGRSDIPFEQQIQMDIEYVNKASWKQDFSLLFKTIPAVLSGRGAY